MAIKRGTRVDPSTSASSMTDLMFQLLLFMLISTTLINPNGLNYYVEMEPVSCDQLEQALQAKMEGAEDPTVSLHCDKTVPVDEVVKVMNIAKNNKYKLILATSPN